MTTVAIFITISAVLLAAVPTAALLSTRAEVRRHARRLLAYRGELLTRLCDASTARDSSSTALCREFLRATARELADLASANRWLLDDPEVARILERRVSADRPAQAKGGVVEEA